MRGEGETVITLVVTAEELRSERIEVRGDAYRHLFCARRLGVGARVRIVDGGERARWSTVTGVDRESALLEIGEAAPDNEPATEVELAVAVLRPERASWLVEKATEIGVSTIRWFRSDRAPRSLGPPLWDGFAGLRSRRWSRAGAHGSLRSRRFKSGQSSWSRFVGMLPWSPYSILRPGIGSAGLGIRRRWC